MDKTQYFITLAAWIGFIFFTSKTLVLMIAKYEYNNTPDGKAQRLVDKLEGLQRTFKVEYNPYFAVISIIWLITYYFG